MAKGGYEKQRLAQKKAQAKRARVRARRKRLALIWAATVAVAGLIAVVALVVIGGGDDAGSFAGSPSPTASAASPSPSPSLPPGCTSATPGASKKPFDEAPAMTIDTAKTYRAVFDTNCGKITVSLLDDDAPTTVNSFVFLAREGFYDGTIFHRVIGSFGGPDVAMLQGGDGVNGDGTGDPGYEFKDENLIPFDKPGYLAMANSGPGTNGSQFFFLAGPVSHLNAEGQCPGPQGCHSVFGVVLEGLDVVRRIGGVPTEPGDKPVQDVVVRTITIQES